MHKLKASLVAPCGMNCGVCRAHLRANNRCLGCNVAGQKLPISRERCFMRLCSKRTSRFCCDCKEFPCKKLMHLDKRYRTKYGLSEIENLQCIRAQGIRKFMAQEQRRWVSTEGILCVHDGNRYFAGFGGSVPTLKTRRQPATK